MSTFLFLNKTKMYMLFVLLSCKPNTCLLFFDSQADQTYGIHFFFIFMKIWHIPTFFDSDANQTDAYIVWLSCRLDLHLTYFKLTQTGSMQIIYQNDRMWHYIIKKRLIYYKTNQSKPDDKEKATVKNYIKSKFFLKKCIDFLDNFLLVLILHCC